MFILETYCKEFYTFRGHFSTCSICHCLISLGHTDIRNVTLNLPSNSPLLKYPVIEFDSVVVITATTRVRSSGWAVVVHVRWYCRSPPPFPPPTWTPPDTRVSSCIIDPSMPVFKPRSIDLNCKANLLIV